MKYTQVRFAHYTLSMWQRLVAFFGVITLAPFVSYAHEVYVLSPEVVQAALMTPRFSFLELVQAHMGEFLWWAFVGGIVVVVVFVASVSHRVERVLDPYLAKLPPFAPVIGRITIGLSFLAAAYYQALFGPELPLESIFGAMAPLVTTILVVTGIMMIIGAYARIAALIGLGLFAIAAYVHGTYLFTYTNYAGELILLTLLGAHRFAFHHKWHDIARAPGWLVRIKNRLAPYAFLFLRIGFGFALIYASVYAKVIHNQLAFALTQQYPDLVAFFGFDPHFLILGAAIIEILIGLFFILGIEIRFTALFMLFWLSLSLWYFGEAVWPHIILIGIPLSFICYGYDKNSLEGYFFKRDGWEPVL